MKDISITINTKTLWIILGIVAGVFVAWKLKNFLMVVLVSVIIASFMETGSRALKRYRIPKLVSVPMFYITGLFLLGGIFYLIIPVFMNEIFEFVRLFPEDSWIAQFLEPMQQNGFKIDTLSLILGEGNLFQNSMSALKNLQGVFGGLVNMLLVLVISFYLSVQDRGVEQFLRVVIPEKYESYVVNLWQRTEKKIGYWFGGQVLVALFTGLLTYIGLLLLGVPYALVLAAVATFLEFVPFGSSIAAIPALIIGYLAGGVSLTLQIFILYTILHYVESYFISPYILHRTVGIPMLVILLSVIACFELFGIIGVVIAIPIAVIILELVYDYDKFRKGILETRENK